MHPFKHHHTRTPPRRYLLSTGYQRNHDLASIASLLVAAALVLWASQVAFALPTFTNVAPALGINHVQSTSGLTENMSAGVAAADFDGDGLIDLFFTRIDGADVLYHNTGNGFVDVSAASGFTQVLPTTGVAAGDIDNDGDEDLYVTATGHNRFYLYINDGTGHFTEQAATRGADVQASGTATWKGMGVAFGDYDRDGYIDILTSDHSRPTGNNGSRLLHNLGAANPGHFEDVTHAAGIDVYRPPLHGGDFVYRFQPQFTDIDHDGKTDIVFSADDHTSQLFWNNGDGTFTDGTQAAGVGTDTSGMGNTIADYDGDGDLDWFLTAIYSGYSFTGNRFYRNNGDRTFTDVTTAAGVRNSGSGQELAWGWGTSFFDYDNDGRPDLMMTNGSTTTGYTGDHTTLRRNNGDGTFTDVSTSAGILDNGQGRGLIHVDFDNDGDLDVVIAKYGSAPIVYRNEGGNGNNWLNVKTRGTISNRDGLGAWITLVADAEHPEQKQMAEIRSGESYLSQSELTAHFGLGTFTGAVDLVEIVWPSGLVQRYVDLPVNSTLMAVERLLGDYDGNSIVDSRDYVIWRHFLGATGNGLAADAAGPHGAPDGVVDNWDYLYWQANFGLSFGVATGSVAAATVPEPTSLGLIFLLSLAVFGCRPRDRRSEWQRN